ncbi:MAG: DUF1295 domain-containing protein, partial [Pseudomonadales bacterium]|nr:DUF1295 domain-containing protein [Pseudomonadales bacterium]
LTQVTFLWALSVKLKDASIIDIYWGFGYVNVVGVCVLVNALNSEFSFSPVQWLLAALVTIWGMRLTLHLGRRNIGKGEDYRYAAMRRSGGPKWWLQSYVTVYLLQMSLMLLICLPVYWVLSSPQAPELGKLELIATLLWLVGFFFESVGDYQLDQFKRNRRSSTQILDTGLWRYTRHPNYFGDALQWWAFFLFAVNIDGGWMTIISPIIMTLFLVKVSGVALLEKGLQKTKPHYADYVSKTPAFIPWFPKP